MRTEAAIRNALLMYCSWRDNHDGGLLPFSPDTTSRIASTVLFQVGAVLAVLPLPDRKLAVSAFRTESADLAPRAPRGIREFPRKALFLDLPQGARYRVRLVFLLRSLSEK